ncbi:family 20 glycosylhydrolase [Streptomyces sp. NPDC051976]|uniref:family 20 glycosylhydrolase n=1 Tax=Streptomyces sp. NPDC051976 TaxID=3154947 RepID=UPI0034189D96
MRRIISGIRSTRGVAAVAAVTLAVSGAAAVSGIPTATAAVRAAAGAGTMSAIVPQPVLVQPATSVSYPITSATTIYTDAASSAANQIGGYLAGILRPSTGYPLPVTATSTTPADGIALLLSGADSSVGAQGYQLDVTASGVVIRAQQPAGLFAGVQTLRQILPPQIESATAQAGPWTVPGGHIVDHPRFGYRGAMLDVARHFSSVATVKRDIDQLALYKINYLHLHLTDDQGWRLAINGWPDLTAIGGATGVGGGPGGFYTQADYQAIVAYAAARYITVVPEIDMPGHTGAAQSSYPSLNCDGKAKPVSTSTAVGASSLCMTDKPTAEAFVDAVIGQVAALTPGPYINIGGDEAHSTSAADYAAFMTWAQQDVVRHGKTAIGWNQIVGSTLQPSTIAVDWDTSGNDPALATAATNGTGVIMAPANHAYIDQKYNASTVIGLSWAANTDVQSAYGWDPGTFLTGAPAAAIRGIEAPLWAETVTTPQDIDYLTFPRLPAYAELGWSPQATHDFTGFASRLAAQGPRWDVLGIRYYHSSQISWPVGPTGPTGPVVSQEGGTCVDVTGGSSADGTPVEIWTCHGGPNQQWTAASDGTLRALGKCLAIAPGAGGPGVQMQLRSCDGSGAQNWKQQSGSLVNPASGLCLNVSTGTSANGSALQTATCGNTRPQWFTTPAGGAGAGPSGPVDHLLSGKCVDVTGGSSVNATAVELWTCNGSPAQQWTIQDDGSLHALGKCLDITSGGTADGTKVQLYTCNGTAAQQWRWNASSGESLVNPQSGKCLDDPASSTANGTQLIIWACHDPGPNQVWRLP